MRQVTIFTGKGADDTWFTSDDVSSSVSAVNNPYTFTGRRLDTETGLMYFRNRYYSTTLGRFISRDALEYVDGWNLYRGYFAVNGMDAWGYERTSEYIDRFWNSYKDALLKMGITKEILKELDKDDDDLLDPDETDAQKLKNLEDESQGAGDGTSIFDYKKFAVGSCKCLSQDEIDTKIDKCKLDIMKASISYGGLTLKSIAIDAVIAGGGVVATGYGAKTGNKYLLITGLVAGFYGIGKGLWDIDTWEDIQDASEEAKKKYCKCAD